MDGLFKTIALMHTQGTRALRDPVWGHIHVPLPLQPLLNTAPFIKLRGIRQLGPCHLVYPGAGHDRLSHSLGVFWVAFRFLEQFHRLGNPGSLGHEGSLAFLAAALCHDLGHFPYTHSLKELPLEDHEALSGKLVRDSPCAGALRQGGISPDLVAVIIDKDLDCTDPELLFYRSVLSGVLDPDKLDYLKRDAFHCGVPYGSQDLDFLLSRLRISSGNVLCLPQMDASIIEHLLFSKYLMYKAVYWHRDVRIATATIKKFLHLLISRHGMDHHLLYNLDDPGFMELSRSMAVHYQIPDLPGMVSRGENYLLACSIPWNDIPPETRPRLENLDSRAAMEEKLADLVLASGKRPLLPWSVILDVPENISFEVSFPMVSRQGSLVPFLDSGTVFSSATVAEFTRSLRQVRILVHPDHDGPIDHAESAIREFFGCPIPGARQ